jgi:uncharacterized damage-inducible protein DinB
VALHFRPPIFQMVRAVPYHSSPGDPTLPNAYNPAASAVTADAMLAHWQGHRRLTRRMIEAFPDDKLFTYSIGGMRTFGELALEMLTMGAPMVRGTLTGKWESSMDRSPRPRAELLRQWDEATKEIDTLWKQLPPERFGETIKAFGQYDGVASDLLLYVIDNEIHHRGQGYVYLRSLGIDPPPFYERH